MAYYRSKYHGVEASVDAINTESANQQLEWLLKSNPCVCSYCREEYYKQYSVRLLKGYDETQTKCVRTHALSSIRFV